MTEVSQEAREAEVTQADIDAAQAILDTWFNRSVIETILARHRQSAERGEVDRLRSELNKARGVLERLRDFDGWQGTFHAGHAYDAKQDAIAYLEGTSHAD